MTDLEILQKIEEKKADFVESGETTPKALRGLVVFYINVGTLPPHNAEAYITRYKEKTKPAFKFLEGCFKVLYLPIRDGETRVEFLEIPKGE